MKNEFVKSEVNMPPKIVSKNTTDLRSDAKAKKN